MKVVRIFIPALQNTTLRITIYRALFYYLDVCFGIISDTNCFCAIYLSFFFFLSFFHRFLIHSSIVPCLFFIPHSFIDSFVRSKIYVSWFTYLVLFFFLFSFFFQSVVLLATFVGALGTHPGVLFKNFKKVSGHSLMGNETATLEVDDSLDCSFACVKDIECFSYNFGSPGSMERPRKICELSNSIKAWDPQNFKRRPGFDYYGMVSFPTTSTLNVLNGVKSAQNICLLLPDHAVASGERRAVAHPSQKITIDECQ